MRPRVVSVVAASSALVCLVLLVYAVYSASYVEPTDAALARASSAEKGAFFAVPGLVLAGLALLLGRRGGRVSTVGVVLATAAGSCTIASAVALAA